MNDIEQTQDSATDLFTLASRMSGYVTGLDMVLMEEAGNLEELGEKIAAGELTRDQYSPIFKRMTKKDARAYNEIMAEISAVANISLNCEGDQSGRLSDTFKRRASVAAIKMQELLVSVAVSAGLMTEEDLIDQMAKDPADEQHAALLRRQDAQLLALIVSEAALRP